MAKLDWVKDSKYNEYSASNGGAVYQITPGNADDEWYVAVKANRGLTRLHDGPVHGLNNAKKIAEAHAFPGLFSRIRSRLRRRG
jgi:hypothetical protein